MRFAKHPDITIAIVSYRFTNLCEGTIYRASIQSEVWSDDRGINTDLPPYCSHSDRGAFGIATSSQTG
ncbi:MAG: hypothetical protein IGR92_03465 [Leptolyngbyaceae cyanobacterium T60_A2020_046]|nr:hypothetical protein [Leptolyngbyaceae cyanobacterium T60_A2020_046]